jgi:hypothetical protein
MSFTEICEKFEAVLQHLRQGSQTVSVINNFFKNLKKASEAYSVNLAKVVQSLSIEMAKETNMDTLSTAIHSLQSHIKGLGEQHHNFSQ